MKKKIMISGWVLLAFVMLFTISQSFFVTAEDEYTLVKQFGKVDRVIGQAGLSFKIPFIETVYTLPNEILLYDLSPSDVITKDKKTMICDSYVVWRITDALKFAKSLNSNVQNAENRIDTVVYNATKTVIGNMTQEELIIGRSDVLQQAILDRIGNHVDEYGIEIISVETKKLDLPGDNKAAVYERMISERDNIAATYTAEGQAEAQVIRNETDKEVAIMLSEAEKNAEILRAEGEREYMKTISEAYGDESRAEFYDFIRSLDAAKESLGDGDTLFLSPDSPIVEVFYK